jgi:cytochrome c-type biogenesis protein CcmH/NrfG
VLFERIRRTQKPVFIFLAFMFGLGFVALGIGQGANSINLGDLFNSGSSSGTSISDLSSRVQSHPKDAGAWLQLARAYQADGQNSQAISSFQNYLGLKPNNATALSATATLLEQRGQTDATKVQQAQAAAAAYTQVGSATAASSLKLAPALTHPLMNTLAQPATTIASTLEASAVSDFAQAMGFRQKLVKLSPRNASYQLLLARDAYATQSYATVATALERYVALSPNLPKAQRTQLEQQITQFKLLAKSTPSSTNPAGPTP